MLHCTTLSVAGGSLRQGVGGGVMEDGTTHAPLVPRVAVSSNANPSFGQRKSSSLPGYYSRSPQHLSPHSFRDAFTNSRSPTPTHQDVQANPPRGHNAPSASQPRVATVTAMVNHQQQQQKQQQQQQQQQQKQRYPQLQHQPQHLQQQIPLQRQQHVHPNERQQSQKQKQNILQQQIPPHQYQKQQQVPNIYKKQQQEEQNYQDVRHQKQLRQDLPKQHQQQQQQQQKQQQQQQRAKQAHYEVQRQVQPQKSVSEKAPPQPEKKSKRSLLSGIFRRRKKEASTSSSSSSSSESEEPPQQRRTFLRRRFKKKESKDPLPPPPPPPPDETTGPQLSSVRVMAELDSGKNNEMVQEAKYVRTQDGRRLVRVIPNSTGSLGRDDQSLGIPVLLPEPGNLTRCGVSASHDSLPVSLGSWAGGSSHASLGYHSGGGMGARSSSTDTITKKERREALKARVERLREKFRDTSSDEDKASMSSHSTHGSESSLCKTNSLTRRSRTARTERFLRRKSQELETLRTETEKDRRNREVVQARIQEIQRIREIEAERNKINEEKMLQLPEKNKPKWSAKLVYQESSEYESSFVLRTPSVSPAASPHTKPKFQGHSQANTNEMKDGVILRHKPQASASVSLAPPYGPTIRRSFQDFENTPHTDLRNHRSTSYDSNLNRNSLTQQPVNSFNSPQTSNKARVNKYGLTPPPPPPRDKSRILSPGDGRPMSFSFENLNQDSNRPNSSQSSRSNFTKGSSPSPSVRSVPAYLGPKSNMQQKQPSPINAPSRPSFSELHLPTQEQAQYGSNNSQPPARPIPPGNTATYRYRYTDQPPTLIQQNLCNQIQSPPHHQPSRQPSQQMQLQPNSNQVQYYTDQSPQYAKVIPISNVPPSPSSDYSSYMSDNSLRIQQISTAAWLKNEQDAKNKIGNVIASQAISDSSRSNSPKVEHCNSTGAQKEGIYASIQTKKARPAPLTLKQAESLSSLSGQSDVSSPVPKALDSDSSQSSLAKEKKKVMQNRPLSMVLEKSESAEKESPPHTPKTRPQPPRRGNRQLNVPGTDLTKRQMLQEIMKHKKENPKDKPIYQKEFQEMFRKEKERLEKSKCNNFEEALQELEEIYDSLKLDNEDLLDRAERRDLPISHQQLRETGQDAVSESQSEVGETDSTIQNRSRPRAPKSRRSGIPDKKGDDMHYRRCQQGSRNQPDVQKALQMTGSYLLVSPAHTTPSDIDKDLPKDPMLDGEPDIVYDDVSYRNIKQANSLKVIDPQPPFGVPLGPTTQGSPNDYLHVTPKENYRPKMIARKEPDVTMDDLAFRSLRKDQQSGKEVNVSELDELLSETTTDSPVYKKKTIRSVSADRARSLRDNQEQDCSSYKQKEKNSAPHKQDKNTKQQTPRRVKHQNEARRAGRFFESYKDAVTDGDGLSGSPLSPRHNNPSWLERANLVESKWDNLSTNNLSTSTETLTEMSSARAVSQPDIRQAIIREARAPPGGPMEFKSSLPTSSSVKPSLAAISVPNLAKLQTIQSAPSSPAVVEKKPYRPLDSIFNNKPKPFYLVDNKPSNPTQQNHVDIAKLDALISTLSKIETNEEISDESSLASKTPTEESLKTIVPNELEIEEESTHENISAPQRSVPSSNTLADFDDEKYSAKVNIQKAIRLSMAKESSNSEGKSISSRRRSAIDLPIRGTEPTDFRLSASSTNVACLNVSVSSGHVPGPSSPQRVYLSKELPSLPLRASTFTDKVESMIVVSENVHDRARRAHSVPASPRQLDNESVFNRAFELALANISSKTGLAVSEMADNDKSPVKKVESSAAEDEEYVGEPLSPLSHSNHIYKPDEVSSIKNVEKQNVHNACENEYLETSIDDESPLHISENVQHDIYGHEDLVGGTAGIHGASQAISLTAPLPPVRSSSLPPSPAHHRATSLPAPPVGSPSPSHSYLDHRQNLNRIDHKWRGGSMPVHGRATGSSSSDSDYNALRAGSLPPTSLLPRPSQQNSISDAQRATPPRPHSCSSGECDDDQESGAAHQNTKGRQAVRQTRRSPTSATKQTEKSKADSEKLRTKRRQPDPPKDRKSDADRLREREKRDKRLEYARLKVDEREKRKSGRERASPSADNKVKKPQEKKKSIESREKSEGKEKRPRSDHQQRKGEEREKRKSQEFKPNRDKKKSVETNSEERRVEEEEDVQKEEKDNKSLSPERDDEMVHHKSSGNDGVGEGGGTTTLTETERAEQERRERIQRYKEERRKQIAARYGTAEWSSSDDSGGGEDSSYRAYRRRRRAARDNHDTSSTEHSNHDHRRTQENGSSSLESRGPLRMVGGSSSEDVVMGVSVRSTRASRLRQAAQSSSTLNNNNNNNNNNSCSNNNAAGSSNNNTLPDVIEGAALQTDGVSERARGEPPADSSALKRLPNQVEGRVDSADSTTLSGSDGRSGRRGGVAGEERDKSHKRKSNLNRSTTSEVLPPEPLLPPHPSDSNEETPRRRRRRGPVSPVNTSIASVATPEPLKTPEVLRHVVSRLTPPASPPTHPPTQPSPPTARQRLSPQPTVPPHSFQPIQPAASHSTQSAPSTLDSRTRLSQGITSESSQHDTQYVSGALAAERSDRSETEDGNTRKLPPKLAPLRKPEIPDVLRPKDTSSLASPGVVNTPPNSRPSSVVLEKPPLAPEGIRPAVLRSSLRKPPDTGTCFMATRREKLNDSKPDIFREIQQRPRKGDRLSKSDMNLKVDPSQSNKQSDASSPGAIDSEPSGSSSSPTLPGAHISSCDEVISSRLESLTTHARDTMERADRLVESSLASSGSSSRENSADNVVHECEEYLSVNASSMDLGMSSARSREAVTATNHSDSSPTLPAMKGLVSDTGQKNWVGGSEGHGKESKWMAIEKEVNRDCRHDTNQATSFENANMVTTSPSGPPNHESYVNDNMHFPLEEEARDLRQLEYEDEDLGSPDSVMKSPEYRSKRGSRRCSLDGGSPRTNSPDPQSILKRRSSREDVAIDRPTTPEPHSILKRKSSSRTSSIDTVEGEPKPILKKKSSNEELDHFEPRPILKKKSSTDDELDDRPRSILKGGRSREDLDRVEGVISPTPILKRSPRCEYEAESELRPILKRRDTTDGVRLRLHVSDGEDVDSDAPSVRVRSDSAPEAAIRMRGRSPPAPSATPHHGILKKRGAHSPARHDAVDSELGAILRSRRSMAPEDTESSADSPSDRPVSPSLIALTRRETSTVRGERPLSVAERVAGMEAARQEPPTPHRQRSPTPTQSPGARPKVMPSTLERSPTHNKERESGKHCAFDLTPETPSPGVGVEAINEAFLHRPVAEAYNSAISPDFDTTPETPSSVSQKAAFFAQLERDQKRVQESSPVNSSNGTRFAGRRDRATRHATQPVTEEEVSQAARLADAAELTSASHESNSSSTHKDSATGFNAAREAVLKNASDVMQGLTPGSSPRRRQGSRKSSLNEPEDDSSSDSVRGILKREGSAGGRETHRDSPRSILKHSSSDSRRASFSESDHPRSILKPESPLPPSAGSPEHEAKMLRGVLKKDSSLEDSKEIKSILKPESESLEPDHSSDSSSDDVTLTTVNTPQGLDCDLADCIKDIDPVRHKEDQPRTDSVKVDSYKTDHHRADLAEALKQVEPIKAKDDLAEALRQIEPIRAKERSREREDWLLGNVKELSTASKVTSSITAVTSQTDVVSHMTTTNTSSSSSENEIKLIKNEAVMRRKNITTRKYDERRSMVELRSLEQAMEVVDQCARASSMDQEEEEESSDSSDGTSSPISPTQYPNTLSPSDDTDRAQNLRQSPTSRKKGASPEPLGDGTKYRSSSPISSSINARLAALQKNGEDGWKNRVKKETKDVNSNVTLRPKPIGGARERPVSLMERMSALESSSQQWRGRVSQSDATQFTVAHKMASASTSSVPSLLSGTRSPIVTITPDRGTTPTGSPQVERKKRSPCQKIFKSKTGGNIPAILSKSSPSSTRRDFRRSISTPNDAEKDDRPVGTSVAVPLADDESFDAFFSRTPTSSEPSHMANSDSLVLEDADLDLISHSASQLVIKRRSVRITRRQVASRNPLKALAARKDLKSEYTEVKMGVGEKELRRMKVEELSKGSPMAVEALAGLASKENFSAVSLKKVENTPIVREMAPYTSLMLLQVKGRRHAQTRLVEPSVSSVNEGDDFVLITPTEVFHFKGGFANVIERAKAAEIAQYIVQKKDMGITTARNVIEIDTNSPGGRKTKFWKLIGGNDKSEAAPGGIPDEDEYVEASIVAANKIYEVQGDSLVPLAEHWGQMPKVEILSSDSVLVFDFGAELYIWAGKRACGDERKVGIALGRELWEEEYDYTECDINPITPMTPISKAKLKGVRPDWGVCAKLTENVETILFKEKFIDWPDLAQQSRIKEVKKELDRHIEPVCELQPCDAQKMLEELPLEPDLVLEMSHLGRGIEYYDEEERRLLSISTNDYKVWHISEYGKVLMDSNSKNQLHAGDTYVVRWYYIVTATGRTLKGEPSKHNVTGRSRVAYFFWQGQGSSVSDKGVSALMTVELDEERGPHIRVTMGKEPPAFLNLFEGGMVVHLGRRDEAQKNQQWKLFLVRGEMENEGHLIEVEVDSSHLRSRGCIVLVNLHTGTIHLWYGAKALRHTRKVGSRTASKLSEAVDELGWKDGITRKVKEQYEGAESRDFWEGFGGSSFKKRHFSLLDDDHSYNFTPRMWHLVATPDSFQTSEVVCSYRATELPNPLPLLQEDLYSVAQPALFVVDGGHQLWVWQGWWPDDSSEGEDFSATGSAVLRFNFARRAALQTALNYNQLKAKKNKTDSDAAMNEPQLVVAGMEPLEFTNLFPVWTPKSAVTAIQMKEGRWTAGGQYLVADILRQLSRTHYTLSELTAKPLPDGADPLHLEVYLGEDEFIEALGMTRDKFYSLQAWKQTELKKKAQLF